MSLLRKAVDKTKETAAKMIDNAKEVAQKKAEEDRKRREEKERQFRSSFPYKYMLSIRKLNAVSAKHANLWVEVKNSAFLISDCNEVPVVVAQEDFWLGEYKYKVSNCNGQLLGTVRKHFFNFGFPFVKDRHGCTVKVAGTNERFRFTTCLSFGDREFGGTENPYELMGVGKSKNPKVFYVKKGRKNVLYICKVSWNEGFFDDRYIVGYDELNDGALAVLCGLAVRLLFS